MKVHPLNEAHHVPCIIFLKPKCAISLGLDENVFVQRTCPSKKREPSFAATVWNYGQAVQVVALYIPIGLFFSIEKKK
jgi:hypothetical protein